jgi:hypothetical protein
MVLASLILGSALSTAAVTVGADEGRRPRDPFEAPTAQVNARAKRPGPFEARAAATSTHSTIRDPFEALPTRASVSQPPRRTELREPFASTRVLDPEHARTRVDPTLTNAPLRDPFAARAS